MKFGFIGAGNMAGAIVKGMTIGTKSYNGEDIFITSKTVTSAAALAAECGGVACETAAEVVAKSDVLVLAVKPHVLGAVLPAIKAEIGAKTPLPLVISIAAGKSLAYLAELLPEGTKASLPTEAQWERACRAGGRSAYSFGDEFDPQLANCRFTSADLQARNRTTPVRSYPPNAFGLYDMHGNVWEWCADAYAPYDPQAQVDPVGVPDSDGDVTRSCRGGSWFHGYERSRSASRGEWAPTYRSSYLGFRIILYKEGLE